MFKVIIELIFSLECSNLNPLIYFFLLFFLFWILNISEGIKPEKNCDKNIKAHKIK